MSDSKGTGHGGEKRGYSWAPAEPGNTLAVQHGSRSPRMVDPIAAEIAEQLLSLDSVAYLRAPEYAPAVLAWARVEAQIELLTAFITEQGGVEQMLTAHGEDITDEHGEPGALRRVTRSRRIQSAWSALDKTEARAATLRARLGLDPLSRARLGRDVAATKVDLAQVLSQLTEDRDRAAQVEQEGRP